MVSHVLVLEAPNQNSYTSIPFTKKPCAVLKAEADSQCNAALCLEGELGH